MPVNQPAVAKSIELGDVTIPLSASVTNLGAVFDKKCRMEEHATRVCRSANYYLHRIRRIRDCLNFSRLWAQSPILTSLLHTLFFDCRVFLFRISNMAMVNWLYGVTLRHVKHQLVFQLQRQWLIVLNVGSFITTIRNTLC